MTQVIAITGKSGSGKDTVAAYLQKTYLNVYVEHFAAPLKRACAAAFGIDVDAFHDPEKKEVQMPPWDVSPRQIAQFVGTEMFRDHINILMPEVGSNFWAARMAYLLNGQLETENGAIYTEEDTIVIADLRFQNEYEMVLDREGIIIHLTRDGADGTVGIPGHRSEKGIQYHGSQHNYLLVNNGTMEELHEEIEVILTLAKNIDLYKSITVPR